MPYVEKHINQFRGPTNSRQYNKNAEDVYQDLVFLYNKANQIEAEAKYSYSAFSKDITSLIAEVKRLVAEKPAETNTVYYTSDSQIDTSRFDGGGYEVTNDLVYNNSFNQYEIATTSSNSRIKYLNSDNKASVPPQLKMVVTPKAGSVELDSNADTMSNEIYRAIISSPGKVWETNVSVPYIADHAESDLFFNLPNSLTASDHMNRIDLVAFPVYGVQITGIYYTEDLSPSLDNANTTWVPFNKDSLYTGVSDAVGYVPPGAWSGDELTRAANHSFVLPKVQATAIKITLKQEQYTYDDSDLSQMRYVYTYGLSHLDVRHDKFESSGEAIFLIEANDGETISSIDQVTPYIYNVPSVDLTDYFDYEVIWETSFDSGSYTSTPVPSSSRVWLKITLTSDANGHAPILSGFKVEYS